VKVLNVKELLVEELRVKDLVCQRGVCVCACVRVCERVVYVEELPGEEVCVCVCAPELWVTELYVKELAMKNVW